MQDKLVEITFNSLILQHGSMPKKEGLERKVRTPSSRV